MNSFKERLKSHEMHVINVGLHCTTEETTKQALILPLLDILGFNPYDPTKVKAEYGADFPGAKANERVDYALFCHSVPVLFIEAKPWSQELDNHCPQLSRYFNATPEVSIAAITNGREWRFFTDLEKKNIMDPTPFLKIRMDKLASSDIDQLYQFRHDEFQPEALRTLAEESIFLTEFTKVISSCLRDVDQDFVRFVAQKAKVERQLNQRFIDFIRPIVRQAVEKSVSAMVVSGLSSAQQLEPKKEVIIEAKVDDKADIVDPNNSKIVTTYAERLVFDNVKLILGDDSDINEKDTASYFNVLYNNKTNRWIIRYFDSKQRPTICLPIPLSGKEISEITRAGLEVLPNNHIVIDRPENVLRIAGIIKDCYDYCVNDENFKNKKKE